MLTGDRATFAQLYDRLRPEGAPDFKTVSLLRVRPPAESAETAVRQDILAALQRAEADAWLDRFSPEASRAVFQTPSAAIDFQAIANPGVDFEHIGDVTQGLLKAMVRCCRVVYRVGDTPVRGSGFLIGPQLVLTSWHVVRGAIGADEAETRRNGESISVEFDVVKEVSGTVRPGALHRLAEDWLVHQSRAYPDGAEIDAEKPWTMPEDPGAMATYIDYAILQLAEPVGYERGWYDLKAAAAPPPAGAMGQLVQFPGDYAMRVTPGAFLGEPAIPARLVHGMNSIRGSSGGLCATPACEPVALHQGAIEHAAANENGRSVEYGTRNVAIPLGVIAAVAGPVVDDMIRNAPRLVFRTRSGGLGEPILGRENLQAALHEAIQGAKKIVLVRNSYDGATGQLQSGVGKTFTIKILEAMVETADHMIRVVRAQDLSPDPFQTARTLAAALDDAAADSGARAALAAVMGAVSAGDTSPEGDARTLAGLVVNALRNVAGARTLWLVIDDLDRHPLDATSGAADLLNQIYAGIAADPQLRAVIIGPTATLPALSGLPVAEEGPLSAPSQDDVERWIRRASQARPPRKPPDAPLLARMVALFLEQDTGAAATTAKLADVLRRIVEPELR